MNSIVLTYQSHAFKSRFFSFSLAACFADISPRQAFDSFKKYGLFQTDFLTLKRTIRKSGEFIKKFISRRSFSVGKKGKAMILSDLVQVIY